MEWILFTILIFSSLNMAGNAWSADLGALSKNAQLILVGKVLGTQCKWAETTPTILSHTTFEIEKCIKGGLKPGDKITIQTYGGNINGMKQKVANAPTFQDGDHGLVFLNPMEQNLYHVYQGKDGVIPVMMKGDKSVTKEGKGLSHLIQDVELALGK